MATGSANGRSSRQTLQTITPASISTPEFREKWSQVGNVSEEIEPHLYEVLTSRTRYPVGGLLQLLRCFLRRVATGLNRTGCLSAIFLALWAAAFSAAPASRQPDPPGVAWEERVEVASGAAYQGPWRMNESQFLYVD